VSRLAEKSSAVSVRSAGTSAAIAFASAREYGRRSSDTELSTLPAGEAERRADAGGSRVSSDRSTGSANIARSRAAISRIAQRQDGMRMPVR